MDGGLFFPTPGFPASIRQTVCDIQLPLALSLIIFRSHPRQVQAGAAQLACCFLETAVQAKIGHIHCGATCCGSEKNIALAGDM